jgi:glycosyltransferase involved in cell wall biosynthesis
MHARGAMQSVSICICTYNRDRLLRQTLARVARLLIPRDFDVEVVVIDNNSTDNTARVLAEAAAAGGPRIRSARETTPGIAAARNAAVALSTGQILLWLDDDVLIEPDWLQRYAQVAEANPSAGFFGGPVRPHFEGTPPGWVLTLLPEIWQAYALREFPPGWVRIDLDHLPFGANFASRREVNEKVAFDPALGRVGKDGGCLREESAFFEAALDLGYGAVWLPDNPVQHVIPAERQTVRYLRGFYAIAGATPPSAPRAATRVLGRPRWLWREWVQNEIAFLLLRYTASPLRWFPHLKRASYARGALFHRVRQ